MLHTHVGRTNQNNRLLLAVNTTRPVNFGQFFAHTKEKGDANASHITRASPKAETDLDKKKEIKASSSSHNAHSAYYYLTLLLFTSRYKQALLVACHHTQ